MVKLVHNERDADTEALDRLFALAERLAALMERGMAERGLTSAGARVVWLLHQNGAMVQRRLSEAMRVTPRHVTGVVDALEAEGWVARGRHPTDRRATLVSLTERGAAAVGAMDGERREFAARLFGDVSAGDLERFVAVLDRVLNRLGDPWGDPA